MSYQKQNFENNSTVLTAEHMNHIEDGIKDLEKVSVLQFRNVEQLGTLSEIFPDDSQHVIVWMGDETEYTYTANVSASGVETTITLHTGDIFTVTRSNGIYIDFMFNIVDLDIRLDSFIEETDIATNTKAGVIKVGGDSAGVKLNTDGMLVIASAGTSEINAMASANRPITPYYLKYAIKAGLTKNDLDWTDEEKAKARQVIDAIGQDAIAEIINTTLEQARESGDFDGADGKTPYISNGNWFIGNIDTGVRAVGKDGTVQIEPLFAEGLEWLKTNGDTSKVYILPDNFIYAYFEKESTQAYTNLLPLSTDTNGNIYNDKGYKEGYRLNSSGEEKALTGMMITGYMPYTYPYKIRIKDFVDTTTTNSQYVCFYDSNYTFLGYTGMGNFGGGANLSGYDGWIDEAGDRSVIQIDPEKFDTTLQTKITNVAYIRVSYGDISNAIITVNEEIIEGGSAGGYDWHNTGHSFIPTDYEDRINELEDRIDNINTNPASATIDTEYLRNWDNAVYDANIPVFETESVKPDKSNSAEHTPNDIYALYDDLMSRYPQYITRTDLGLCSDNIHHLYRYDIQTPETYHTGSLYSEKKVKAFLMSGIHNEYICIYGMFYALEELVSNPDLRPLLRNVHLIVLPCANPYAMVQSHNTIYLNANGVEIHRNFEVGFVDYLTYKSDGVTVNQYSGTAPLTEPESIAIDNIMKTNTDLVFVLSAHSFGSRTDNRVMWCSAGTKYTCNLATRIISKMSDSWRKRFADDLADQESYGYVSVSGTGGSEYRQAAKYGIHGFNIEVSSDFVASTNTEYKKAYSSFGISRYAEVYANVLLTAFGVYDYKDKDKYCKYIK